MRYLETETNRAIFSSFKHFETSEDVEKDPVTILLLVSNVIMGLFYLVLYILEAIRTFIAFRRLQFSQKVGHIISMIMVAVTLFVLFAKVSRQGGFETQLTLTIVFNVYMWHLAFLYAPDWGKQTGELTGTSNN